MENNEPLLLDLFCCEGGASRGYADAGFSVVGADLFRYYDLLGRPKGFVQSRYPYPSYQGDALALLWTLLDGSAVQFGDRRLTLDDFAVIAASPPCQAYSITKHSHSNEHPQLIEPVRELLVRTELPYIIENVVGAPLNDPVMLCGSMFDLTAVDDDGTLLRMERHRLFESNVSLSAPRADFHDKTIPVGGAYGGGSVDRAFAKYVRRGGYTPAKHVRGALLGINWMTLGGLSQSVPPAYTAHLGRQMLAYLAAGTENVA